MGKRCQVCDGPVVNGRCKYCGMPYRNDLELYHLNEERSEHYRHASAKVRKAMAESEIPLPDRNKMANKSSKTSTVTGTVKKPAPKSKTEKAQTSVKKESAGRNASTYIYTTNRNPAQEHKKKKKSKKGATVFWIIVVILLSVAAQTEEYWDSIGHRIESFINDEFGIQSDDSLTGSDADRTETEPAGNNVEDVVYSEDELNNYDCVFIDTDGGTYTIGETYAVEEDNADTEDSSTKTENEMVMNPGEYVFESGWEEVALEITDSFGDTKTVKFDKSQQQKKVELHTGDQIEAVSLDSQYNYLTMYEIQQYDE